MQQHVTDPELEELRGAHVEGRVRDDPLERARLTERHRLGIGRPAQRVRGRVAQEVGADQGGDVCPARAMEEALAREVGGDDVVDEGPHVPLGAGRRKVPLLRPHELEPRLEAGGRTVEQGERVHSKELTLAL